MSQCLRYLYQLLIIISFFFVSLIAYADHPIDNTPIENEFLELSLEELANVELYLPTLISAHIHAKGEWMLGVHEMFMHMSGLRDGTSNVTPSAVLSPTQFNFMAAPREMDMSMTMFHLMYGVTDKLTAMVMLPYLYKQMDILLRNSTRFTTRARGIGDTTLHANYLFYTKDHHSLYTGFGVSLPTGAINKTDFSPMMMMNALLPYPMQLGTGTVNLHPVITYIWSNTATKNNFGVNANAVFHVGRNYRGYRFGDEQTVLAWFSHGWNDSFSTEVTLNGYHRGNIHGSDSGLNPMASPTANPKMQEKTVASLSVSAELYAPQGKLKGNRLTASIGKPFYEEFTGPQLRTKWFFELAWKYTFLGTSLNS